MKILLCNVGSTSLKFKLYDMPSETLIADSKFERIGEENNGVIKYVNNTTREEYEEKCATVPDFTTGIKRFLTLLTDKKLGALNDVSELAAVGFKAPHGRNISGTHIVDNEVLDAMEDYAIVSPLHIPNYIRAMKLFKELLPRMPLVAVFETAFHQTFPEKAKVYGIPADWKKYGFRHYGFHGNSHGYISSQIKEYAKTSHFAAISCHMGGSTSLCAIKDGKSQDCSFGFSAQSGIDHAQRNGDLDVFIPLYMMIRNGYTAQQISDDLNYNAGLKGISGIGTDMRDIEKAAKEGNRDAQLAIDTYCYEIIKYIGAYYAVLGGLDYLVFTGGIGENSVEIRSAICAQLRHLGVIVDEDKNSKSVGSMADISAAGSKVKILVIRTNEEIGIAREAYKLLSQKD